MECLLTPLAGAPGIIVAECRRSQQSGFNAGRSTADAILALRLLSDLHREFCQPLNVG